MTSNIILESEKGSELTIPERDQNMSQIRKLYRAAEDFGVASVTPGVINTFNLTNRFPITDVSELEDNTMFGFIAGANLPVPLNVGPLADLVTGVSIKLDDIVSAFPIHTSYGTSDFPIGYFKQNNFYLIRWNSANSRFELVFNNSIVPEPQTIFETSSTPGRLFLATENNIDLSTIGVTPLNFSATTPGKRVWIYVEIQVATDGSLINPFSEDPRIDIRLGTSTGPAYATIFIPTDRGGIATPNQYSTYTSEFLSFELTPNVTYSTNLRYLYVNPGPTTNWSVLLGKVLQYAIVV